MTGLRAGRRPAAAVSLVSLQTLSPALLGGFEQVVNHPDGLLPEYRGLAAVGWARYHGQAGAASPSTA